MDGKMKITMLKKSLVVTIFFLVIAITIVPSVNVSVAKAATDNELVEVTTKMCGIKGFRDYTVKLTKQQYYEVQQLTDGIKERLDNATTRDESVAICNEAIVKLNTYGLLPKGMSVERAQKLISSSDNYQNYLGFLNKLFKKNQLSFEDNENWCCVFASRSNCVLVLNSLYRLFFRIYDSLSYVAKIFLTFICAFIYFFQPFFLWCPIEFIDAAGEPRNGWVFTAGLNGIKTWEGYLMGAISLPGYPEQTGVVGFTGIKIENKFVGTNYTTFLLGTAFHVKINTTTP